MTIHKDREQQIAASIAELHELTAFKETKETYGIAHATARLLADFAHMMERDDTGTPDVAKLAEIMFRDDKDGTP